MTGGDTGVHGEQGAVEAIIRGALAAPVPDVRVYVGLDEAARALVADTLDALADALAQRGVAHLCLTGGSGGAAVARALVEALCEGGPTIDTRAVHLWFGDERFVPTGDLDRNDLLVSGLACAGIPAEHIHALAGPDEVKNVESAARLFSRELDEEGPDDGRFDVIHLGVGPDAHVCSLFPGHPSALATDEPVVAVEDSPKPPSTRVSFSFTVLQRARRIMLVAAGGAKADAVRAGLATPDPVTAPASCARGERTTWYVDADAAAEWGA